MDMLESGLQGVRKDSVVLAFNLRESQVDIVGGMNSGEETEKLKMNFHGGIHSDSFIVRSENHKVDIRFLGPKLENYLLELEDGLQLFLQNDGETELYFKLDFGTIRVNPGERKEVCKENIDLSEKMNILENMIAYAKEVGA